MKAPVASKAIILLLMMHNLYNCVTQADRFFSMRDGYRRVENIIINASVATATHCAKKCIKHVDCTLFNVGPIVDNRVACEIVGSSTNQLVLPSQQTGWTMYYGKQRPG